MAAAQSSRKAVTSSQVGTNPRDSNLFHEAHRCNPVSNLSAGRCKHDTGHTHPTVAPLRGEAVLD